MKTMMNRRSARWSTALLIVVMVLLAFPAMSFAAKGGQPGKPGGGEEGAGNQLSLPAIAGKAISAFWNVPETPVLGTDFSYGCEGEEFSDVYSYPNTSCVNDLMVPTVYYNSAECTAAGMPCEGKEASELSRIFWQKVGPYWSADQDVLADEPGGQASVAYVDWGDALEAVSWNEKSRIRVETQPYSSRISGFDPTSQACEAAAGPDAASMCKVGFQMWHVSGQGTTEHWGVRTTEGNVSYNYDSPFQIINTGSARLNLAKMESGSAECPMPGGGDEEGETAIAAVMALSESPDVGYWTGSGWSGACTWLDETYSVELSVGGKYVYGYNWPMRDVNLAEGCQGWEKTGWWRLTFYTTDDAVLFNDAMAPVHAPPASPAEARALPRASFNTSVATPATGESEVLYTPVIDASVNNLSYLDICIVGKTQGGGGGGGNKPK